MRGILIAAATLSVLVGANIDGRPADPPGWNWELPRGFPVPLVPADNPMTPERVELGRRLFYDARLSGNGTQSCASCHRPELAFTDGLARAVGSTGEQHPRGSMSLINVAYNASYNWSDKHARRLEGQALVPMYSFRPVEMGIDGHDDEVLDRLRADPDYPGGFAAAFPEDPDPLRLENVPLAIAAFERTLISGNAPYYRLVYHGESDALSPSARRGMRLFFSERTRCATCHAGFNFSGPVGFEGVGPVEPVFHDTGVAEERGVFRAPTLLNIELTAPYMHDGSVASLSEVIALYAAGGREEEPRSERVSGFAISEQEIRDLVAFLESLTDSEFLAESRFADPFER